MNSDDSPTLRWLNRIGGIAALSGALALLVGTMLHPSGADPNDAAAAFAEYAASNLWIASHLTQFMGLALLGVALIALARTVDPGPSAGWAWVGVWGAAISVATGAALQAVDGVALKVMVDRWAAATGTDQVTIFETAFAVRQIEVGLASLMSLVFGLTVAVFGVALALSARWANWLGWTAVLGGLGVSTAGIAQAYTGFSPLAMNISMPANIIILAWAIAVGVSMLRRSSVPASALRPS